MNAQISGTDIARRLTVEDIVAKRNCAMRLYSEAFEKLTDAIQAISDAVDADVAISPSANRYNYHLEKDKTHFHYKIELPPRDQYMETARHIVDTDAWAHIIELTDLELLMDKTAKDAFNQQLLKDPPEFTVENVCATLESTISDAGTIFKRGIAKCFSELDRRFKSHDGWKIGSRIILSGAFDCWGHWSYYRNHKDTIMDVERVFAVLDGEKPKYCTINAAIDEARSNDGFSCSARQTEVESEYFLVRIYKNGNCHIWFKRDDLVARVNKLLAEYYGAVIPEEREAEGNPLDNKKTSLARHFGFYPTPETAASYFLQDLPIWRRKDEFRLRVLEPSAGTGNLARRLARIDMSKTCYPDEYHNGHIVDCIEIQPALADALRAEGIYNKIIRSDFLMLSPSTNSAFTDADMLALEREKLGPLAAWRSTSARVMRYPADPPRIAISLTDEETGAVLRFRMRIDETAMLTRAIQEAAGAYYLDNLHSEKSQAGRHVNPVRLADTNQEADGCQNHTA